jgi:hypothetical protein
LLDRAPQLGRHVQSIDLALDHHEDTAACTGPRPGCPDRALLARELLLLLDPLW